MRLSTLLRTILCVLFALCSGTRLARAEVIYQAFDERFVDVERQLPHIAAIGYDYVQVSPPAKSADASVWWARYQPLNLDIIAGPLGTEGELRQLIGTAHKLGLKVLIDTVLNHMADVSYNNNSLNYPQFSAQDFHEPDARPCVADYNDRFQVTHYWLCDPALGHHLPDLDTASAYVRGVHKKYLAKLLSLGADGFRFDAAKHIEPEYWRDVLTAIPPGHFYYGEVIGQNLAESQIYTPMMLVTDFHLLSVLLGAFSAQGDLRSMIDPQALGAALPGASAVVFARNHDTAMHADFFNFGDYQDAVLATALVVARGVGTGFVYRDEIDQPEVAEAVHFHKLMAGRPTYVRTADQVCGASCDPRTLLFVERGEDGVMILNSSNAWVDAPAARMPGLAAGCYRDQASNFTVGVAYGGDGQKWINHWGSAARGGLNIGPRTALYLVKTAAGDCAG